MKRALLLLGCLAVGASIACAALAATSADPKQLVLRKSDVPSSLRQVYASARWQSAAYIRTPRNTRVWIVAYASFSQPVVAIASGAFVFSSSSAAHIAFSPMATRFNAAGSHEYGSKFRTASVSKVGDEQRSWIGPAAPGSPMSQIALLARTGSVVWIVDIARGGTRQTLTSQLLTYARKQKQHIVAAG